MIYSCGVIPVRLLDTVPEFLVLRNYNHWDFPKGCMEQGEDELACAIREFQEESGLKDVDFKWGTDKFWLTEPYTKPRKIARYYVGLVDKEAKAEILPNPETGRVEHQEFRWCEYDLAAKLLKPRILKALDFAVSVINDRRENDR